MTVKFPRKELSVGFITEIYCRNRNNVEINDYKKLHKIPLFIVTNCKQNNWLKRLQLIIRETF